MSGTDRHSVLIDLDRAERRSALRTALLVVIAAGTVIAAAMLARAPEGRQSPAPTASPSRAGFVMPPARTLSLPADVKDVDLSAFPDWLANEQPPPSLRAAVAIRGTTGIASVEGPSVVNWTEDGISYRLESTRREVAELVVLAASLR